MPTNKPDRNADDERPLEIVSGIGDIEVELGPGIEPEALMRSFYANLARDIGKCRNPLERVSQLSGARPLMILV